MGRLEGKVALITGAASQPGIGSATALRFGQEGAIVHVTDIDVDGLTTIVEQIRAEGGTAVGHRHDVSLEADWSAVYGNIRESHGGVDVVVNNAGIVALRPIEDLTEALWRRQLSVNLDSVYFGTRGAVASMRQRGGGSIINVSSVLAMIGVPTCGAYAATKGAIRAFTKSIALETARERIRINSLHPGQIETNIQGDSLRDSPGQYAAVVASIPWATWDARKT